MPEKLEIHIILTISKILKDLVFTKCTFLELDWSFEIYQKPLNFFEKKNQREWRESALIKSKKSTLYNQIPNPLKLPSTP